MKSNLLPPSRLTRVALRQKLRSTGDLANLRYRDWQYTRRLKTEELGSGEIGYVQDACGHHGLGDAATEGNRVRSRCFNGSEYVDLPPGPVGINAYLDGRVLDEAP